MGHPAKLEVPLASTSSKHARIARKFSERIGRRPQTPFLRAWLSRNLLRWRRTIRRVPPFRRDPRDRF